MKFGRKKTTENDQRVTIMRKLRSLSRPSWLSFVGQNPYSNLSKSFMKAIQILYYLLYIYQRTLEETGKRGQETYYLKSCLQLSRCLAFYRLFECTGIKVCLITSFLVKPSSSRTLLVQTPQLTFVSRNRIPDISLHSSSPYDKGPHPR